jgi:hypothetical protein
VLNRFDKASSLAATLSSTMDLIEGHVDAVATSGVHWGGSTLITVLTHFPELELFESRYNADLPVGQLETFWTQTCQASESLSSWIPPSVARSPPDGVGEE